jgi:hypothetical protein
MGKRKGKREKGRVKKGGVTNKGTESTKSTENKFEFSVRYAIFGVVRH